MGAKGYRRQAAAFLTDDELAQAVEWYWRENPPPADGNIAYWTRPKLAAIARAWMREFQPEHLALLERAWKAGRRAEVAALVNGSSEDEAAEQYRLAFNAAVRRAIEDEDGWSASLERYWPTTTGKWPTEVQRMSEMTLENRDKLSTAATSGGPVAVVYVLPGDAHRLEGCGNVAACRWHGRPRPMFPRDIPEDMAA
jgi:hypothetical protein